MAKKERQLGKVEKAIYEILTDDGLDAEEIMELIGIVDKTHKDGQVRRDSSEYRSAIRALGNLVKKGRAVKLPGKTIWKKAK